MSGQKFTSILERTDRGHVRLPVPFDPQAVWGTRQRHYFVGTVNGFSFSGSLGTQGGVYFTPLKKELRTQIGVGPGDTVEVVMKADPR